MRDVLISNCEKQFIHQAVSEGCRLDGRYFNESRKLTISFGSEWGSCVVSLGETRVLAQVTCEVTQPKQIRPNEGTLHINVDVGPMAGPQFEANRPTDLTYTLNRQLEKLFKDSKCIDLEALCIVVEEKVWALRIDVKVLNHEGNVLECASIAGLTALAHFKRPDVTKSGDDVIVHTLAERDPIPTVLYHYPVCTTFAIFDKQYLLSDPTFIEEAVCMCGVEEGLTSGGGLLAIGMNQYREVCLLNLHGAALAGAELIHTAAGSAAQRCKQLVDSIKQAIVDDDNLRSKRQPVNFSDAIESHEVSPRVRELAVCLQNMRVRENKDVEMEQAKEGSEKFEDEDSKYKVVATKKNTAEIQSVKSEGPSAWIEVSSESESEDDCVIIKT